VDKRIFITVKQIQQDFFVSSFDLTSGKLDIIITLDLYRRWSSPEPSFETKTADNSYIQSEKVSFELNFTGLKVGVIFLIPYLGKPG
jgi:hypothetical protein